MAGVTISKTWDGFLTTTLANYRKKMIDNIFDHYALLSYLNGKLGRNLRGETVKRVLDGGSTIVEHLEYATNTAIGSITGAETMQTTIQDLETIAEYEWKLYYGVVSLSGTQMRNNSGRSQMINLLNSRQKNTVNSLRKRLNEDAFGDGTGNSGKNLTGLQALVSATSTVGRLNPSTFSWWKANVKASTGAFTSGAGLADMRNLYNTLTIGSSKPDFIITTQDAYEKYDATLQPQQRIGNAVTGEAGFDNLVYRTIPMVFDRDCPSGYMYMLNSEALSYVVHRDADFKLSPFVTSEDADVTSAKYLIQANLTTNNRRKLGVITGIT